MTHYRKTVPTHLIKTGDVLVDGDEFRHTLRKVRCRVLHPGLNRVELNFEDGGRKSLPLGRLAKVERVMA